MGLEQVTDHTAKTGVKLLKKPIFLYGLIGVGALAFFFRRKGSTQDPAVAIDSYPQAPPDQSGISSSSASPTPTPQANGATMEDLQNLYDQLQNQQGQMMNYFDTQIKGTVQQYQQQAVQQQQQAYVQQQPIVQKQTALDPTDKYSWLDNGNGSYTKPSDSGSITFTPTGSTSSGSSGGSRSNASGVYSPSSGGGSTFTPGKVSVSMPSTEGKAAVTQTKDGYSYGGKSYSSLGSALHAAGAKGW